MRRPAFTLIEVMVAIVLLAIVSGVIGLKMHGAIEKKKFQSDIDRLKVRMIVAQRLAIATQADWKGVFKKEGSGWLFSVQCEEENGKQLKPLHIAKLEIALNGKTVEKQLAFDFFAGGHTSPVGNVSFTRDSQRSVLQTTDLFQRDEGERLGPPHPNE